MLTYDNQTATAAQVDISSRLSQGMSMVHKLIAENTELAATVEQRLYTVLRPTAPQASGTEGASTPKSSACPMADDLGNFAYSLEQIASRYRDILDRLEV